MSDPAAWGIESGYHDVRGNWNDADPEVVDLVLEAMGATTASPQLPDGRDVWVVHGDEPIRCDGPWELSFESGERSTGVDQLAQGLPLGYHRLERDVERGSGLAPAVRLIVAPRSCHLPEGMRSWGWAAQLPSVRSASSWGMGDLGDLARLGRWSSSLGAQVTLLNPLHASLPGLPQQASPYYSSSRCFRNPIYLRVEDVPGAQEVEGIEALARTGRLLNDSRLIDRDRVWALKMEALELIWAASPARSGRDPAFAAYCAEQGDLLQGYAVFCAMVDKFGRGWSDWPEGLRRPGTPEVRSFSDQHNDRVRFHAWLQYLVDAQIRTAGDAVGLVQDLAIGADPAGADAWLWQDVLALSVKVGAPPDEFNVRGQDWGFPPFDPWKLRAAGFDPFVRVVRAVLAHAGGLRIDHVAGLFRLFWIPEGVEPSRGVYVRFPWQEMLAVLALESVRAGAWVVGEDLGTVEPYVREEMARRAIMSTKLVWFEPEPPARYPDRALAAVTTHDLPTVAGLWTRSDLEDQRACGVEPNAESAEAIRQRLASWLAVPEDAPVRNVVVGTHQLLGQSSSAVILATLEDALAVEERPNVPGTSEEQRPNWSRALPVPLEALEEDALALNLAAVLDRRNG